MSSTRHGLPLDEHVLSPAKELLFAARLGYDFIHSVRMLCWLLVWFAASELGRAVGCLKTRGTRQKGRWKDRERLRANGFAARSKLDL